MSARRAPTATVVSTGTSIARSVPATGDGISVSTLSVETSRSASSTATESPTFFSQRVTVPSLTDSPSAGIVITVPADGAAATGAATTGAATTGGATGAATTGAGVATGAAATGVAAGAAAPSAMIASSAPTRTVVSTATTIFCKIPATGEGISVSTLSVETSRSGSSTAT